MSPELQYVQQHGMKLWEDSYGSIDGKGRIGSRGLAECQMIGRVFDKVKLADHMLALRTIPTNVSED